MGTSTPTRVKPAVNVEAMTGEVDLRHAAAANMTEDLILVANGIAEPLLLVCLAHRVLFILPMSSLEAYRVDEQASNRAAMIIPGTTSSPDRRCGWAWWAGSRLVFTPEQAKVEIPESRWFRLPST